MLKQLKFVSTPLVISLLSLASLVQAEENTTSQGLGYLGLLAGGNSAEGSQDSASPTIGVTFGTKLAPNFGVGFLGSYFGETSSGSLFGLPTGTSASSIVLAGQANYFLGGFHMGGEMGAAINSWSGRISNSYSGNSNTAMIFGPQAGYDFAVGKAVSLGAEAHYLVSTADNGSNNFQIFAAVKFWQ